mgnify:FL=1
MRITLTAQQLDALEHVLGCVYDNERDKGTDGIGQDMLESIEHYHDTLYPLTAATDGTYHWDIPFHIAGLLEFFIDCYGHNIYYVDEAETQEQNAETVLAPVRAQLLWPDRVPMQRILAALKGAATHYERTSARYDDIENDPGTQDAYNELVSVIHDIEENA